VLMASNSAVGLAIFSPPYTSAPSSPGGTEYAYTVAADSNGNAYVANGSSSFQVLASPYTGTPFSVTTTGTPLSMLVAGNTLFVGEQSPGGIDVFTLPVTASSTPVETISSGQVGVSGLALDASGNLWVADYDNNASYGSISEFTKPFSSAESPAVTIDLPVSGFSSYTPYGIAFDPSGNLYVCDEYGGASNGGLLEFTPPITSSSTAAYAIETSNFNDPFYITIPPAQLSITP
jgi:hypothetical protein